MRFDFIKIDQTTGTAFSRRNAWVHRIHLDNENRWIAPLSRVQFSWLDQFGLAAVFLVFSALQCLGTPAGSLIVDLKVEGTRRAVSLETHAGQPLDRERVAQDLRRLWASGNFDDIRVEVSEGERDRRCVLAREQPPLLATNSPGVAASVQARNSSCSEELAGVSVVFKVVERPRYVLRHVKFQPSYRRYPAEAMPGSLIDKAFAYRVAAKLRDQLIDNGFADAEARAEVVPVGLRQADLHLTVRPGPLYRVSRFRFSGNLAINEEALQRSPYQTTSQMDLPSLGDLWKGSSLPFSQRRLESALDTLRSLYFSRGYWDAVVLLDRIAFDETKVTVSVIVESGARYEVNRAEISGDSAAEEKIVASSNDSTTESLCRCLRRAQRDAEMAGKLDFKVQLDVQRPAGERPFNKPAHVQSSQVSGEEFVTFLKARIETGPSYKVGRIDFQGNHNFGDSTLRRALLLNEGDLFDYGKLRASLSRLNQMGFFEPLTQDQVRFVRDPVKGLVDVTLMLKEKPHGRWDLSGSADPFSLLKPVQFSIGSRLPNWGSKTLELSTYFASLSLFPLGQPLTPAFLVQSGSRWKPLLAFGRPYLPGQGWSSGFVLLPQLGWRGTAYNSGLIQAQRLTSSLGDDPTAAPTLTIRVWRLGSEEHQLPQSRFTGSLLCENPKPHLAWVKSATLVAVNLALTVPRF
jgi:hypothetical protein